MPDRPRHAVLLAAGQGTRMWPLTATRPKPTLPVAGQALLARWIDHLADAGLEAVTVVAAREDGPVARLAADTAKTRGLELDVAAQHERRGTGHALLQADLPDAPTLVAYADLFLPAGALEAFLDATGPAGIGARRVDDVSGYGALATEDDRLVAIEEKPDRREAGLANAGVYVMPPGIGEHLARIEESPRGELELTDAIEAATQETPFRVHTFETWFDVGWPWDLLAANAAALDEIVPAAEGTVHEDAELVGDVHVAEGATVRRGSVIQGPAYIGPGATVGPNAYVRGATTLGPNAKVGHACEVKNSVLFEDAKVPHVSYVGDSVLGRGVNLGAGTQVANLRHDEADILVETPRGRVDSGRRKLGVVLGDEAKTGINATLNVGVMLPPEAGVGPGETVLRSRVPENP